jgi:hypothetical protein
MPKGEKEQFSGKQARNVTPTNEKKGRKSASSERDHIKGAGKAEGVRMTKSSSKKAGARQGTKRPSGKKPSGMNLDKGGGSAAKKRSSGASGARGKSARST